MDFHQIAEREVGSAFQDLIHKLKEAAEAELRDVRRELEQDLEKIRRQADALREELETESARAATLEADLDAVIDAHRTVDGERVKAEEEAAALNGRLESARGELTRLQESLESEAALRALLEADLSSTRDALSSAEATVRTLEGNVRTLEASVAGLQSELQEARDAAANEVRELRASTERDLAQARAEAEARVQDAIALADARARELDELRASTEAQLREAHAQAEARAREIEERASGHLYAARDEAERRIREAEASMDARLQAVRDTAAEELKAAIEAAETRIRELQAQADATAQQLKAQAQAELREARERADAEVRQARESSDQALEELRVEAEAQMESVRAQAEAELQEVRVQAAAELRDAQEAARTHEDRVTELTVRLSTSRDELAAAREELSAVRARTEAQGTAVEGRDETIAALERQLAEARETERLLRESATEAREISLRLRDEGQAQATRLADAIARAETAETATRLAEDELATLRARPDTGAAMLQASARALEALSSVASVADLVAALARQLAPHFERVAIFRVKGTHLEGEQGAGLDRSTDVARISVPLSLDSPLTRAAKTRRIQDLDLLALADSPAPLGGSPSAAIAVPIVYQGETFAVAYVDSAEEIEPAPRALAALLAGQAGVLLARLSQEMKLMKELRDYAALLVQEAEQMFVADVESGRPEADRRRRLSETIECARQLFAQRAALEGPVAARALDDYLLEVMTAPSNSAFAADLSAILTTTVGP